MRRGSGGCALVTYGQHCSAPVLRHEEQRADSLPGCSSQAIATAEVERGNAPRPVRTRTVCLCERQGQEGRRRADAPCPAAYVSSATVETTASRRQRKLGAGVPPRSALPDPHGAWSRRAAETLPVVPGSPRAARPEGPRRRLGGSRAARAQRAGPRHNEQVGYFPAICAHRIIPSAERTIAPRETSERSAAV